VEVLGNLKYDGTPAADDGAAAGKLGWEGTPGGEGAAPVLVGGCTHPGEEEALLDAWDRLRRDRPGARLVLAPRHGEPSGEVAELAARRSGRPVVRWSQAREGAGGAAAGAGAVVLVDVIGELERFYRLGDVVFVGGSLIPRGGHNLLEPARLGKPVLFGPS